MMSKEWVMAIVVGLAFSGMVLADEHEGGAEKAAKGKKRPSPEEVFKTWDKDGDGSISLEEFTAQRKAMMEKRAKATGKAAPKVKDEQFKKVFDAWDTDQSGGISQEEFVEHSKKRKPKAEKAKAGKAKAKKAKDGKKKAAPAE